MKRFALMLIVAVVATLVVAAPASAVTLNGHWTDGVAVGTGGSDQVDGLYWNASEPLVVSGNVAIETYPTSTDVASRMIITAGPTVPPFPVKWNAQQIFTWGPAVQKGATWTVNGQVKSPTLIKFGLYWTAVVVADTAKGTLTMKITSTNSYWGWDYWELQGRLM